MKNLQSYDEFLNEKAYLLTGIYSAKGIVGKVIFAFKKHIESIKFEGDVDKTIDEINSEWDKWSIKEGANIIKTEVLKQVKSESDLSFVSAYLGGKWKFDLINKLNSGNITEAKQITLAYGDFVINVAFNDDVDAKKYSRRLGGYTNTPILVQGTSILIGAFDDEVGYNNVEIREGGTFIQIDAK